MGAFKSKFLQEAEARGFLNQCTNMEALDEILADGKPVVAYWGTDPTASSLHVGHIFSLMIMRLFQRCGNKPIILIGGATGMIGDPSGRDISRPMMTEDQLLSNRIGIKKSVSKFIKFGDGDTDAIMVDNYDWGRNLNWLELLREIGPHISVNRMLTMESVKLRLEKEEHMSFLEFNYMVMQAYDFYQLYKNHNCIIQLCGSDQWGNVVAGVDLIRRMQFLNNEKKQEVYGLSTPLLTDKNGKKIGKSAGNAIWINDDLLDSYQYFQYFRNMADEDIERFLKIYTDFSLEEVANIMSGDINKAKEILAFEATKMCRGEEEAKNVLSQSEGIFKNNSIESLPIINYNFNEKTISQLLKNLDFSLSIGEAKKLIRGGGVKIDDEKVLEENLDISTFKQFKLSIGKKKHFLIKIK